MSQLLAVQVGPYFSFRLTMSTIELGTEATKFLSAVRVGSRTTYKPGLLQFQRFLSEVQQHINGENNLEVLSATNIQGIFNGVLSTRDFLKEIIADRRLDPLEQKFSDREILKLFAKWLVWKEYTPKSVWTYVGAIQRLSAYYGINIDTTYLDMPHCNAISKKHPWEIESIASFVRSMKDEPVYQTMAVIIVQSGLGISDLLALDYGDIKNDYEANIAPLCLDLVRIKTNTPHLSFIGSLGARMLRDLINSKKLGDSEKLFCVTARSVEKYFRKKSLKFLGSYSGTNPMRPHSLRSAFDTLMTDDGCQESYTEFFMGHKLGDIKKIYKSKTREGWRKIYSQHERAVSFVL